MKPTCVVLKAEELRAFIRLARRVFHLTGRLTDALAVTLNVLESVTGHADLVEVRAVLPPEDEHKTFIV